MHEENEISTLQCINEMKKSLMPQISEFKSEAIFVLTKCKEDKIKAEAKLLSTDPQPQVDSSYRYNVVSCEDGSWHSETSIYESQIETYKNLESTCYISGLDLAQDSLKRIEAYTKAINLIPSVENTDHLNMIFSDLVNEGDLGFASANGDYTQRDKMKSYYDSMDSCFEIWDVLDTKFSYFRCSNNDIE
jgi:hypothetical protein